MTNVYPAARAYSGSRRHQPRNSSSSRRQRRPPSKHRPEHDDDDDDVPTPISEASVRRHTLLHQPRAEGACRRTRHEDCCGYCDRYCDDKITPTKRRDIEAWRRRVNCTMLAMQREHEERIQPRLRFLQTSAQTKRQGRSKAHTHDQVNDVVEISTLPGVGEQSDWASRFGKGRRNEGLHLVPLTSPQEKEVPTRVTGSLHNSSLDSHDSTSVSDDTSRMTTVTQLGSRTRSNELLNVISIDDALRHQRYRILSSQDPLNPSPATQSSPTDDESVDSAPGHRRVPRAITDKPHAEEDEVEYDDQLYHSSLSADSTSEAHNEHATVTRAIDQQLGNRAVLNNQACTGLYRAARGQPGASPTGKISHRFNRLNDNLHRLMDTRVLANTKLGRAIEQRVRLTKPAVPGQESDASHRTCSHSVLAESAAGGPAYRAVSSLHYTTPTASKLLPNTQHASERTTPWMRSSSRGVSSSPGVDEERERLLEMIMDMDGDSSDRPSQAGAR